MSLAIETLLSAARDNNLLQAEQCSLFLNAQYHVDLESLAKEGIHCQQYFKPYYDALQAKGFAVCADIEIEAQSKDFVFLSLPKNMIEAHFLIAQGLLSLKRGGIILCAAENKTGGSRLQKMLGSFDISDIAHESRNKCRAVWGRVENINMDAVQNALSAGQEQAILDGRFQSQPGIFGWDKIDKGSDILTRFISKDMKGKGADFGCGYGYLSEFILSHCRKVKRISCIDADYRAVELCRKNLSAFEVDTPCYWADLSMPHPDLRNLDFIVMNPPFHEGKKQDLELGKAFIQSAHQSLRRGGRLWMVANAHLPYENIVQDLFFECTKHHEGQGFKIFEGLK